MSICYDIFGGKELKKTQRSQSDCQITLSAFLTVANPRFPPPCHGLDAVCEQKKRRIKFDSLRVFRRTSMILVNNEMSRNQRFNPLWNVYSLDYDS